MHPVGMIDATPAGSLQLGHSRDRRPRQGKAKVLTSEMSASRFCSKDGIYELSIYNSLGQTPSGH